MSSEVPSKHIPLLNSFLGCRIVSVTRYSWWPAVDAAMECKLQDQDVFSLTAGPVSIGLDSGAVLGVGNDSSLASVTVWLEKNSNGDILRDEPLEEDLELHSINAEDPKFSNDFWANIIGGTIVKISIFRRKPKNILFNNLPNEVALCFALSSGDKFFAAHGLHDDSDDFALLQEQTIKSSILHELEEVLVVK